MRWVAALPLIVTLAACGGTPPPDTSPLAESGMVGGTLRMSIVEGAAVPPVLVSVAGATMTAAVSRLGDFVLTNVPAGPLELRFTGDGIAATLPLGAMTGGETITVSVLLTPAQATVDAIARVRGDQALIEGTVEAPTTPLPSGTFIVGGRVVSLPAGGTMPKPGTRIRVTGTITGAGIVARELTPL